MSQSNSSSLNQEEHLWPHIIQFPQDLYRFTRTLYGTMPHPAIIAIGLTPDRQIGHHQYFGSTNFPVPVLFRNLIAACPHIALVAIIHHARTKEWEPLDRHLSTKYLLAGHMLEIPILDYLKTDVTGFTSFRQKFPRSSAADHLPFLLAPPPKNTAWPHN